MTVGDGCALAGADWFGGVLRKAGERLRSSDIVVLAAAGICQVQIRKPRIVISAAKRDAIADALVTIIARDLVRHGVVVTIAEAGELPAVFERADTDAIVTVGGTGSGSGDDAIIALRRNGRVAVHGIALSPGETSAVGFVGARPVLMVPGRADAALAVWLAIGRTMLARLSGVTMGEPAATAPLSRKVTSTIGISDVVPVELAEGKAEPLATRYLPLSVLARADGWVLVPPESEGYPAGSTVTVNAWL
jgi:molybdopterin biosynthesis enzyme